MMQFCLKFLKLDQNFFIKMEVLNKDCLLCWCNGHNLRVNFDEKSLFCFEKFNKKD